MTIISRVRRIGEAMRERRLSLKERDPRKWSRRAVTERACAVAEKLYGVNAPDIEESWLLDRESSAVTLGDNDIPKIVSVARVIDLDVNELFLLILR